MAEPINLNKARKARAKADAKAKAASNRAKHGRTKTEKSRDARKATTDKQHVDGHKRSGETDQV